MKWTSPPESMKSSEAQQETQREAILGHSPRMHWGVYVACLLWDETTNFWYPRGWQWEAPTLHFACLRDQTFSDIPKGRETLMYKAASWSRIMVLMKGYMSSPIWEEGRKIDGDTKTSQAPFWSSRHVCANSPPQHPGLSSDRRDLSPHALGDSHCEMRSCEMRLSLCFSRWGWRVPKVASCQSWAGLKLEPLGGQEQLKS